MEAVDSSVFENLLFSICNNFYFNLIGNKRGIIIDCILFEEVTFVQWNITLFYLFINIFKLFLDWNREVDFNLYVLFQIFVELFSYMAI